MYFIYCRGRSEVKKMKKELLLMALGLSLQSFLPKIEGVAKEEKEEEMIQVIVECSMADEEEEKIKELGVVKYTLPMIDAYVVELPKKHMKFLRHLHGVKQITRDNHVTAQMDIARKAVGAEQVQGKGYRGSGIGVAVLDSGIFPHDDLHYHRNRIVAFKDFVNGHQQPYDDHYHGTHVAGIIGGDGYRSNGKYRGIAPACNLIGIKILDEKGKGNTSDVLAGIQWMIDHRQQYNIRVANLSIGTDPEEGEESPLIKAVNAAWDAGIVVVVAAGNNGPKPQSVTIPGIGRKVITVGASDDQNTVQIHGDTITDYSGRGPTKACIKKPDVVAPGSNIMSCDSNKEYIPSSTVNYFTFNGNTGYRKSSGTSMSTPMISGAIALLLERNPKLTPNEVKARLKNATMDLNYPQSQQGWGLIQVEKLVLGGEGNV